MQNPLFALKCVPYVLIQGASAWFGTWLGASVWSLDLLNPVAVSKLDVALVWCGLLAFEQAALSRKNL